jgi:hypothetical protein
MVVTNGTALTGTRDGKIIENEIKEIQIHLYAYAGFPRALNGLATLMAVLDARKAKGIKDEVGKAASPLPTDKSSLERGKEVQTQLSGRTAYRSHHARTFEPGRSTARMTADYITGKVIVITGASSGMGEATGAVYCATKHAVRAISEGLRQEVKDYNIRVTTISPGAVRTELTDHISEPGLADDVKDILSRIGVPASTMASMVAFVISQPDDVDVNEILFRPTIQPV